MALRASRAWLVTYERYVLAANLLAYGVIFFLVHGVFQVGGDNPAYIDPAARFVLGDGFTSTCWYAQGGKEFWAGNVPLYQFLLIPWFKLTGITYLSVLALNFFYVVAAAVLVWSTLRNTDFVKTAEWRLGAIAILLWSDCAYYLLAFGRHEALSFLLIAAAAYALTIRNLWVRMGCLFLVAAAVPWANLPTAIYMAVVGGLLLVFYPFQFWREVGSFGLGGVMGTLGLIGLYKAMGVWEGFLASVAPHTGGGLPQLEAHSRGGLTQTFTLPYLSGLLLCLLVVRIVQKRDWKLPLFSVACTVAVPWCFLKVGVFPLYYGWYLYFLLVVLVCAIISSEPFIRRFGTFVPAILAAGCLVLPGSFLRRTIKSRLQAPPDQNSAHIVDSFLKSVLRQKDVPWVDASLYYMAKPLAGDLYSGCAFVSDFSKPDAYPTQQEELESITVWIWRDGGDGTFGGEKLLPGRWVATGEEVSVREGKYMVYRRNDALGR